MSCNEFQKSTKSKTNDKTHQQANHMIYWRNRQMLKINKTPKCSFQCTIQLFYFLLHSLSPCELVYFHIGCVYVCAIVDRFSKFILNFGLILLFVTTEKKTTESHTDIKIIVIRWDLCCHINRVIVSLNRFKSLS